MRSKMIIVGLSTLIMSSVSLLGQIEIDGDLLDWADIAAADVGNAAEELGDMPNGAEYDLAAMYIGHDDSTLFIRVDIDPSGTLASQWTSSPDGPAFQLYLDTQLGDTTGLAWGGFWTTPADYMLDLAGAYDPSDPVTEITVWYYPNDYGGAVEEFDSVGVAQIAVNSAGNAIEVGIPIDLLNAATDVRPFMYSVNTTDWDNEEYMPNDVVNNESSDPQYVVNYNRYNGATVKQVRGEQIVTEIEIDGDMLDWATITAADAGDAEESLGDMPNGAEYDLQDMYLTSDSSNLYLRVVVDPSGSLASQWTSSPDGPAFQLYLNTELGDTSGLAWGGFWTTPARYMLDLAGAYDPSDPVTEITVWYYPNDYGGAVEEFDSVGVAQIAVSSSGSEVEVSIPRSAINAGLDIQPFMYSVNTTDWDNEEYMPDDVVNNETEEAQFAVNYNFISGSSTVQVRGDMAVVGIEDQNGSTPRAFLLGQNYPNPFNPSTTINYSMVAAGHVDLVVYDMLGREIRTLYSGVASIGTHRVVWDAIDASGRAMPSGIYFYRLNVGGNSITNKMVLIR